MSGSYSGVLRNETNKTLETNAGKFILYDMTSNLIEGALYVKEGNIWDVVWASANAVSL